MATLFPTKTEEMPPAAATTVETTAEGFRKPASEDYNYPATAFDHQKSFDAFRNFHANACGNQFTFNQSITHVNINNRLQLPLPNNTTYNTSLYPMPHDTMNIMTHISAMNPFQKDALNRNFGFNSYHTAGMVSNALNGYNQSAFPKTVAAAPVIDFGVQSLQSVMMPLPRSKSDETYSSSFYSDTTNSLPVTGFPMLGNVPKLTAFADTTIQRSARDQDVDQADETQKCKNTIEGTKTSVRRFKRWYKERYNKELDMNSVNRFNAPDLLKDFFLDIRDTRPGRVGNEYEPVTLTTYRNGLRRYFLYRKVPPAPDNFDLTDKGFDIVNRHLVTKRDDLKRKGKGNHPNAIESITPAQLEKMWASGAIGTHAPRPLLRLMWWYNTVYHGVRGRMAHHELTVDDFMLKRDMDGKICMEYIKKNFNPDNNNNGMAEPPKKKKCKGMVKETDGGERDAIRAFEIFKAHRPPGIASFYLTPKAKPKGDVWFNKVPMGKNSIGRVMREIKAISAI